MADQKRKLIIEVLGNAKDASKALGDVRSDTDKAAEKFVSFGQVTVAASAAGAVGLYKLASAAGDYAETQSAASVIFGDAVDTVVSFGEEATKTAGLSKRAAVEGANTFGTFGKSAGLAGEDLAGFSTEMVQLAGDLASFKNTSPEQAIEAIGAALRGESEPIRAYGVLLDDATLKQRAMTIGIYEGTGALTPQQKVLAAHAEILAQTGDAQGDYLRTSDSLANQQRTLTAEFENLKVGIGQGVLPVVTQLVGGASDLLGKFGELDSGTQTLIGQLGGVVVTGGLVIGSLSLIAGKVLEARDRFTTLGTDGTRSLNNIGKAAAGLGAVGAAIALYQLADALNTATEDALGLETGMNNLRTSLGKGELDQSVEELQNIAAASEGALDKLRDLGSPFFTTDPSIEVRGMRFEVDNLSDALARIKESGDREMLQFAIDSFRDAKVEGDAARIAYNQFLPTLDEYQSYLDSTAGSAEDAASAQSGMADSTEQLGSVSERSAGQLAELDEQVRSLTDGVREMQGATLSADQAQRALLDASDELVRSLSENGKTLDINTAAGRKNRDALDSQVAAAFELAQKQSLIDTTGQTSRRTLEQQAATLAQLRRDGVIPTDEAYLQLLATYDLTPEAIETRITADTADAKQKAFDLSVQLANMPGVPAPLRSQIQAAIDGGNYAEAERLLQQLSRDRTARIRVEALGGSFPIFGQRAKGGPIEPGQPYVVGEEGPEIVIPKSAGTVLPNDVYRAVAAGGSSRPLSSASGPPILVQIDLSGSIVTPDLERSVLEAVEAGVARGIGIPEITRRIKASGG